MNFQTHNDGFIDINMTSLVGYIQTTRRQLESIFGKDDGPSDKVTVSWYVKFEDGTVASIYDYKEPCAPAMDDIYAWHIGGHSTKAVQLVHQALRDALGLGVPQRRAA